jgi:hypothetical protein
MQLKAGEVAVPYAALAGCGAARHATMLPEEPCLLRPSGDSPSSNESDKLNRSPMGPIQKRLVERESGYCG